MEPISIRELKRQASEAPFDAILRVQLDQAAGKETRQGKTYIQLVFADGVDDLTIRVWSDHIMFTKAQELQAPQFLELSGQWVDKGQYGLEPLAWDFRLLTEEEREVLLRGPQDLQEKQTADYAYIATTVAAMQDPRLRLLSQRFLDRFTEHFLRTAAARTYHHARRGGLVEHVAQMMRSAEALLGVYEDLNADLVLAGVLFHDCGKLWENSYQKLGFTMPHREVGELLGHIPLGIELINKLWRELLDDDEIAADWESLSPKTEDVRLHLLHLIASHHGTHEFGSPTLPKTPEAVLLHFVDNIDAKLEMFKEGYEKSPLLGKNVFERRRPIYHSLVRPLPKVEVEADPSSEEALAETILPTLETETEVGSAENHGSAGDDEEASANVGEPAS